MPAQLLLLNPSRPRRKLKRNPGKPTPAQMAARRRFAAMVKSGAFKRGKVKAKSNPGYAHKRPKANPSAKSKFASTPFGRRILAMKRKHRKSNPVGDEVMAAVAKAVARKDRKAAKKESAVAKKSKKAKKSAPKKAKRTTKKASAKRAAPKAKRKSVKRKSAKRKSPKTAARRAAAKRIRAKIKTIRAKAKGIRRRAKKASGVSKTILSVRARSLSLQARAMGKRRKSKKTGRYSGLSGAQKRALAAHGLTKVNPSLMAIVKDMGVLLPVAGATVAALAGAAILGNKAVKFAQSKSASPMLANPHLPAVASLGIGIAGYIAARMLGSKPGKMADFVNKVAPAIFVGGVAAAAVHTLKAVQTTDASGKAVNLGQKLGLPIADYVVGDYVVGAVYGAQSAIDVDGTRIALNGMGNIFSNRTLAEYVPYSVSDDGPREGARGRRFEPAAADIVDIIDANDGKYPGGGSLAGGIFDSDDE